MAWWFSILMVGAVVAAQQPANPVNNPGHRSRCLRPNSTIYDGHYILSANRIYMVGGLNDPGWDHMDNDAKTVKPVAGTAEIDVNDLTNTGKFEARLKIPEGDLVLAIDKFNEFNPCQNGGIVGFLHEHGYRLRLRRQQLAEDVRVPRGMGVRPRDAERQPLYDNYEMHFMITQGIRDRKTLRVNYPMANKKQPAGEVNPATQQIDFYIRSPQQNPKNKPNREVFMHFFAWRSREVSAGRPQDRRRLHQVVCAVGLSSLASWVARVLIASSQTDTGKPNISKRPTILFMCPHGAAKMRWRPPISSALRKSVG